MIVISGTEKVRNFISIHCVKIATDETGWDTLYQNKENNEYWIRTYPNSEVQGGGHPELKLVSDELAKKNAWYLNCT